MSRWRNHMAPTPYQSQRQDMTIRQFFKGSTITVVKDDSNHGYLLLDNGSVQMEFEAGVSMRDRVMIVNRLKERDA